MKTGLLFVFGEYTKKLQILIHNNKNINELTAACLLCLSNCLAVKPVNSGGCSFLMLMLPFMFKC